MSNDDYVMAIQVLYKEVERLEKEVKIKDDMIEKMRLMLSSNESNFLNIMYKIKK